MISKQEVDENYKNLSQDIKDIVDNSKIPDKYFCYEWEDYKNNKMDDRSPTISNGAIIKSRENAKKICKIYFKSMEDIFEKRLGTSLLLNGKTGSGKTVLGTFLLRKAISLGKNVLYCNFVDFGMEALTASFREHLQEMEDKFLEPDMLMIDEISEAFLDNNYYSTKTTQKIYEYMHYILIQRFINKKPTILTTSIMKDDILEKAIGRMAFSIIKRRDIYLEHILIQGGKNIKNVVIDLPMLQKFDIEKVITLLKKKMSQNAISIEKHNGKSGAHPKPKYEDSNIIDGVDLSKILEGAILK